MDQSSPDEAHVFLSAACKRELVSAPQQWDYKPCRGIVMGAFQIQIQMHQMMQPSRKNTLLEAGQSPKFALRSAGVSET